MDTTNETDTSTDNTTSDQTTETEATDAKPIIDTEAVETEETSEETETTTDFIEYDFDKDVKLGENFSLTDESKKALNDIGKEFGIKSDKIQLVVDKFKEVTDANTQAYKAQQDADIAKGKVDGAATIKKEWGADFDANKATVTKAFEKFFAGDKDAEELIKALNCNPSMCRAMLKVGKAISEDSLETGETGTTNTSLKDMFSDLNK